MSSREPLWYCHECHAEMHPLMVPDPHCASCNGTFVEKLENPADDPRNIRQGLGDDDDPFGPENFLFGLQSLLRAGAQPTGPSRSPPRSPPRGFETGSPFGRRDSFPGSPFGSSRPDVGGSGFTIHINRTSAPGAAPRTTFSTGPARMGDVPLLSEFVSRNGTRPGAAGPDRDTINGPLMFQYLLAMLSQPGREGPMADLFAGMGAGGPEAGRMGDYVFNQEALDQIITQLMENSSAHPVPASEEIMQKLPREVLEEGSPLLEKDCAVCKEQFQLGTEDPDEQIVVTLPCKHPFHEPCIMPWLKSSGTCPVCRYQLVPQPSHHAPGPGPPSGSSSDANANAPAGGSGPSGNTGIGQRSPGQGTGGGSGNSGPGGILSSLFHAFTSAATGSGAQRNQSPSRGGSGGGSGSGAQSRRNSREDAPGTRSPPRQGRGHGQRRGSGDNHGLPGSWNDVD